MGLKKRVEMLERRFSAAMPTDTRAQITDGELVIRLGMLRKQAEHDPEARERFIRATNILAKASARHALAMREAESKSNILKPV